MADLSVLKNIVRTGRVSSVNAGTRTARVTFKITGRSYRLKALPRDGPVKA